MHSLYLNLKSASFSPLLVKKCTYNTNRAKVMPNNGA